MDRELSKAQLIKRLIETDSRATEKATRRLHVYVCSHEGRERAKSYPAAEKKNRQDVGRKVLALLHAQEFKQACQLVARVEAQQVLARGVGTDWEHYNTSSDLQVLRGIFRSTPSVLRDVPESHLPALRLAAGMLQLWGKSQAGHWLPHETRDALKRAHLHMNPDTAVRMIMFHALRLQRFKGYRQSGVVKAVRVIGGPDSCVAFQPIQGKKYRLDKAPELPHPYCAHEMGCRCTTLAVLDYSAHMTYDRRRLLRPCRCSRAPGPASSTCGLRHSGCGTCNAAHSGSCGVGQGYRGN